MKRILTLLAIIGFTMVVHAQKSNKTTFVPSPANTKAQTPDPAATAPTGIPSFVKVSEAVHDYGTIQKGADPYCQFTITNNSNEQLVIKEAKGSCGCTVPEYQKEAIQPGHTTVMKVRYDTNRTGPFDKVVTVNFDGKQEALVLHIKGMVETPPADMPFGTQPVNTGAPLEKGN